MFFDLQDFEFYSAFLFCTVYAIDIVVALHIILNKYDEPERTLLWLLVVFSFPVFGTLLYLFFGINRRQTLGSRIEAFSRLLETEKHDQSLVSVSDYYLHTQTHIFKTYGYNKKNFCFISMLDRMLPDTCPLEGNKVELLCDGDMAYPAMLEAIRSAKHSIHLQSYIISNDSVGKMIFDAMAERAAAGVKVRVIYDSIGSIEAMAGMFFRNYMKKNSGMKIVPFSNANILMPWRIQLRNHRKLLVVDGRSAFIGGINISNENQRRFARKGSDIHDLHCQVTGPAVGELQFSFLRDWCFASKERPAKLFTHENFPEIEVQGNEVVRVVPSGHGHCFEGTESVFYTAVSTAQKYIWIMSPYFVPDKPFSKALRTAAARGVEIKIIVPRSNNLWYVRMATCSLYKTLITAGARIFEKTGRFSHAKAMLVDGEWAYIGSSNCDVRSFRLNYELDFTVTGDEFISDLRDQFINEINDSEEVTMLDTMSYSILRQIVQNLCSLLTPIL